VGDVGEKRMSLATDAVRFEDKLIKEDPASDYTSSCALRRLNVAENANGWREQVEPAVRVSDVASAFEEGILKALALNLSICRQICR